MKTAHLQNKPIKVSGHLEERRGYFHVALNWVDNDGKRCRKSISTKLPVKGNKKRAEELMQQAKRKYQSLLSNMPDINELLFADFMEQWLDIIKPEIKLTTYGGYCMNVKSAIAPYFRKKGTLLRKLTADDVNDFYEEQLKSVKATTVHKYHANISKALKYAVKKGLILHSVIDKVDRPKPERFVGKFLKQSEVVELFEAVKGHKLELGVILGTFYGLRRAEIIGLRWKAVNFEQSTITINHTVHRVHDSGKTTNICRDKVKRKSSYRTLPMPEPIQKAILVHRNERYAVGRPEPDAYLFLDKKGDVIKPDYVSTAFSKLLHKNGLRHIRLHDLRHSSAGILISNRIPLIEVQQWLGHSTINTTASFYAHLEYAVKEQSAAVMSGQLFKEENHYEELPR